MKVKSFSDALTKVYLENPCGIQPTALWKTLEQLDCFHCEYVVDNYEVKCLKLWNKNFFHTYWCKDSVSIHIHKKLLDELKLMIIHKDQYNDELKKYFTSEQAYFRIINYNRDNVKVSIPDGYEIRNVDFNKEMQLVSDVICSCYNNIKPDIDEVDKWRKSSVFDKDLWVWIIDKDTEIPAALGIAELDRTIKEASLEWIQVLPEYRGKKIGKAVVLELLRRLKHKADFITVSGEVDNVTKPERLYRSCGFCGEDIWYVLRKQ